MRPFIVKVVSRGRSNAGEIAGDAPSKPRVAQDKMDFRQVSVFPGPLSGDDSVLRPSPDKSIGTSASSEAGTPPVGKSTGAKKGMGKLESAIQRLAQNALNASRATPSPTPAGSAGDSDYSEGELRIDESPSLVTVDLPEDHAVTGVYNCDLCPFIGKSLRILKHHRRTHFSYRPYGCKYCALKSFYIANIRSHCELKHPGKPNTYLQFEKPSVLELNTNDRRLDRIHSAQSSTDVQLEADKNEEDSILSLASKMLPPLSKEDLALAEQGGLLGTSQEDSFQPTSGLGGPAICPLCPHFLPNSFELHKHLNSSHPGYGPYRCGYCSAVQKMKKSMRSHLSSRHHGLPVKYSLVDPSAPEDIQKTQTEEEDKVKQDAKETNGKDADDEGETVDTPFMREGAEEMAIDTSDMIEYVEDRSGDADEDSDDELKKNLADASSLYSCKHCHFVTKQGGAIRHHVMAHLGYCPYKCGHCGRKSVKSYPIKLHIKRQHPGKPMRIISIRNEEFEATLNTHYVRHAVKNQSLTAVKSSVEVSTLGTWRGKRKHFEMSAQKSPGDSSSDKEKPYSDGLISPNEDATMDLSVGDLSAEMGKSPELLQYEKTLGNRKVYYQCALCGFKCDNNTSIRRHLMWETMYKPYCCSLCKRTDILAAAMRKHIREKHPHGSGRVIFRKNSQKEQRLVSLVNQSRLFTEKYRPLSASPPPITSPQLEPQEPVVVAPESPVPQALEPVEPQEQPLVPKKLANGLVKCPSCPKIMKMKLFRKHMVFHGGHRVKCDICDKTFYYPSDVLKHHGSAHKNLDTPYKWSKLASPVKPPVQTKATTPIGANAANSSGLLKVKIAFKKDSPPEIVPAASQQGTNAKTAIGGNRHPNLITTDVIAYIQETDPNNPVPPHSKQGKQQHWCDGQQFSGKVEKRKCEPLGQRLHSPICQDFLLVYFFTGFGFPWYARVERRV